MCIKKFFFTEHGIYFELPAADKELLFTFSGVRYELNPNSAIDLLIDAENLADEYQLPVHLQIEGFSIDIIFPPQGDAHE